MDMTTMRVVVEITTPSKVRKERSLWERSASTAIQKASRAVTQRLVCSRRARCGFGRRVGGWLMEVYSVSQFVSYQSVVACAFPKTPLKELIN